METAAWAEAAAAWATVLLALLGLIYAARQVSLARETRDEVSRPYVVAYLKPSRIDPEFLDLVIKNFGQQAAYDVRIVSDPPLKRADGKDVRLPTPELSTLAPGQAWSTFMDSGRERAKISDLPPKYVVSVTYDGPTPRRGRLTTKCTLDWDAFDRRSWLIEHGLHQLVNEVKKLREVVEKLNP